jgi:hypothetical protein
MPRTRAVAIVALIVGLVVAMTRTASAQSASDAVNDLQQYNVTFEDGAPGLTQSELNRLDNAAAGLQQPGAFYKVVVPAEPVSNYTSPREFADVVLTRLGGTGRVQVFDTSRVGIASNVSGDTASEISQAETAAASAANSSQSYAPGVVAAADVLGVEGTSSGGGVGSGTGSATGSPGGSTSWIWVVLILLLLGVGAFVLWRMFKKSKGDSAGASTVSLGEGELKVRQTVDTAGNLVLELADRVEHPGAPPEAKKLFQAGAATFAGLQDDLEAADRPELEAVYPQITDAVYKLQSAKALLDGQPAPAPPPNESLFPAPVTVPVPVAAGGGPLGSVPMAASEPSPSYRSFSSSPWLTTAATGALTMLASRAIAPQRSYRPPADDGMFFGGGGGGGRGRGCRGGRGGGGGGINLSGSSRGMGRRR